MIVEMRKFTFLVTNKECESFIEDIRKQGVVHVDELQSGATSPAFDAARVQAERYAHALNVLDTVQQQYGNKGQSVAEAVPVNAGDERSIKEEGEKLLCELERLEAEGARLCRELETAQKCFDQLLPWGNFDSSSLKRLAEANCTPRFYVCEANLYQQEWETEYCATVINRKDKNVYFITFSNEKPDISADAVELPDGSLSEYQQRITALSEEIQHNRQALLQINARRRGVLLAAQVCNSNELSLSKVRLSGTSLAHDAVKLFQGWVPREKADEVARHLEKEGVFFEMEKPTLEDDVPVEIRNGSYSRLFEPILRMYSLPKYSDLDVTPFFAPFFMLFFGLCMGDAGYGLVILALSLVLLNKLKPAQKPYAKLGIYLGAMTIVCGSLTGSLFGIDLTQSGWAFLAPVKKYFVNENNFKIFGYSPMMVIAVCLGLIQVLLGMVLCAVKTARNYGWIYAVGKLSWVVGLIAVIVCFGLPACGLALPQILTYALYGLMAVCVFCIFFLNSPHKNPIVNFGTGIWDTYGMATGLLGDLLSYIRLFALGLTGGVLGSVFNMLAIDMTSSLPWAIRWLPMLLILLLGHGINFVLCIISSVVHPIRLTFVEFFKNADFEGGGRAYEPFRVKTMREE